MLVRVRGLRACFDADSHSNADKVRNSYPYTHAYGNTNSHPDSYAYSHGNTDSDSHAYAHSDSDGLLGQRLRLLDL
jgi:hypothetical protein